MKIPDWKKLALNPGVLRETVPDTNRIVLWVPGEREANYHHWERIGSVANAEITAEQGICAILATSIQARQRVRGFFGKLFRSGSARGDRAWLLPNGTSAEQWGQRQTDLVLAWAQEETGALDESRIRTRWPQSKRIEKIADNLFVVSGIEPAEAKSEAGPEQPLGNPREQAEKLLAAARQSQDRRAEVNALTDSGIIFMGEGDARQAVARLEEALALVRELGDKSRESDVLGNLGMAVLASGQASRALELFQQELALAREAQDRFAEKTALEHLGLTYSGLWDSTRAFAYFEQALALARAVGDRHQEGLLLWQLGIQHAEVGQRDLAIAKAQAAIDLLGTKPQADLFAHYLQRYLKGDPLGGGAVPGVSTSSAYGGSVVSAVVPDQPASSQLATGPGLLRMAVSAVRSMTRFAGSGFKTASADSVQRRLRTCASCEHHTGVRCKICGCFTNIKARLLQEECPIGKWPA